MSKQNPSSQGNMTKEKSKAPAAEQSKSRNTEDTHDADSEALDVEKFLENVANLESQTRLAITYDRVVRSNRYTYEAFVANWPEFLNHRKCAPIPDHCRVVLPSLHPGDPGYVQALKVRFSTRPYIIAQAPLHTSAGNFWRMVYHEEPIAIVVILHSKEIDDKVGAKSIDFWPTTVNDTRSFNSCKIVVTLDSKSEDKSGTVVKYDLTLNVSDLLYSKQKVEDASERCNEKVYRLFHYNAWAEETQPDITDFAKFIKGRVLSALGRPKPNEIMKPLLVVSLNGLNRAPAVCGLMEVAWNFEQRNNIFDLMRLSEQLAKKRPGALSDRDAFLTFYATAFKIATLYGACEKIQEIETTVKNLTKPLSAEAKKKISTCDGSLLETDENDSMDEEEQQEVQK